jgi:hypothetical protein
MLLVGDVLGSCQEGKLVGSWRFSRSGSCAGMRSTARVLFSAPFEKCHADLYLLNA